MNRDVDELILLLELLGKPLEVKAGAIQQLGVPLAVRAQHLQELAELLDVATDLHR